MTTQTAHVIATNSEILKKPRREDGATLHALVASCPPLDLNSQYAYFLLCEHHAQTCILAWNDNQLSGAITAYIPPQQTDTLFVWQVAVAEPARGQGLGTRMLEHLYQHCRIACNLRWLETTISPGNSASHALFTNFALRNKANCSIATLFAAKAFQGENHEEECLYRIGPWPIA